MHRTCSSFSSFTWVISGLLHITLEDSKDEAWITGGRYGLLFANDDNTTGHTAHFSSHDETVLQLSSMAKGFVPKHKFLHNGQCRWNELIGI